MMAPRRTPDAMDQHTPEEDLRTLRAAYRTRVRRFGAERVRMADRVAEAERDHREYRERAEAKITDLEAQNADLRSEVEGKDRELRTILNTKTFRYSAAVRRFYGRLRGSPRG
jgi:hypothetical protein